MSKIKLISWNVNGIRASYRKGLLDFITSEKPDILCLQETKAQLEQLSDDLINVPSYSSHFASAERKGYSGVAVYSKIEPKKVKIGFNKRFDDEGRVIELHFDQFILLNVYFPNGKASVERLKYKMDFYKSFLSYIEKLRKQNPNIIFCGDVNTAHREIDLARPKANEKTSGFLPIEREWIDKVIEKKYIDTFREFNKQPNQYTWWDLKTRARERNVGWRIDYFFVSQSLKKNLKDAFIMPEIEGSDHCPVGIRIVGG